eukprot:tig00020960_g16595.t1
MRGAAKEVGICKECMEAVKPLEDPPSKKGNPSYAAVKYFSDLRVQPGENATEETLRCGDFGLWWTGDETGCDRTIMKARGTGTPRTLSRADL